jgi:YVTN family beta-propeller protein
MSPDRRTAYISNGQSETVSVIDTDTLATVATIPVSSSPQEATVTPDGGRLFLIHQLISEISVIDTARNQVIRTIPISGRENDVLFTLDGRFACFANFNGGKVDVVDTDTYELKSIPTGPGSRRLAMSPTGDRVTVSNFLGDLVSVIDTLTQTLIATVPVGIAPRGIAITPSGTRSTRPTCAMAQPRSTILAP